VRLNQKPGTDALVKGHTILPFQYSPFAGAQQMESLFDPVFAVK
jgi:hypothetical protein